MPTLCPKCGAYTVTAQDIEMLSNSTLLVKLDKRIQLCCQQCGWMDFDDPVVVVDPSMKSARTG
jgi:predicted nucleic-acid-binding Zn-ribbon protein